MFVSLSSKMNSSPPPSRQPALYRQYATTGRNNREENSSDTHVIPLNSSLSNRERIQKILGTPDKTASFIGGYKRRYTRRMRRRHRKQSRRRHTSK